MMNSGKLIQEKLNWKLKVLELNFSNSVHQISELLDVLISIIIIVFKSIFFLQT